MLPKSFLDPQISATITFWRIFGLRPSVAVPLQRNLVLKCSRHGLHQQHVPVLVPSGHGELLKDALDTSHKITWKFGKTMENQAWPSYPFRPPELKVAETLETLQPTPTAATTRTGLAPEGTRQGEERRHQALKRIKPCRSRDGRWPNHDACICHWGEWRVAQQSKPTEICCQFLTPQKTWQVDLSLTLILGAVAYTIPQRRSCPRLQTESPYAEGGLPNRRGLLGDAGHQLLLTETSEPWRPRHPFSKKASGLTSVDQLVVGDARLNFGSLLGENGHEPAKAPPN